jgi:hypothetical protein
MTEEDQSYIKTSNTDLCFSFIEGLNNAFE